MCSSPASDHAPLYTKLPTESPWIRLLRLQAADRPSDNIACTLEVYRLHSELEYKALSYAWNQNNLSTQDGDHDLLHKQDRISVQAIHGEESNESMVTISRSLSTALRRLRTTNHPIMLWVDALCINQQDADERTSQVGLMAMIYRFADEVIIWLGEKDAEDDLGESLQDANQNIGAVNDWSDNNIARSLVDRYTCNYENLRKKSPTSMKHKRDVYGAFCLIWYLSQGYKASEISFYHANAFTDMYNMGWMTRVSEGLRALMERNWWRRAWVVQETVLAKKAIVVYGTLSAPWSMFANAARSHLQQQAAEDFDQHRVFNTSRSLQNDALGELCGSVLSIENTRREWIIQQPVQLLTLLRRFCSRLATDERDKVFSLLGLVNQWMQAALGITYSMYANEVYKLTALHAIEETQSLSVLCDAKSTDQLQDADPVYIRNPTFLTWVPRWGQTLADGGLDLERTLRFENYAAGSAHGHACIHGDSILELKGKVVGTIKAVAPVVPQDAMEQLRRAMTDWEHWWLRDTVGLSSGAQIFWETVCGGCLYKPSDAGPTQSPYIRASLEEIQRASRAWITDTTTKRNRKTVLLGNVFANSYEEPQEVTQLKNAFYYSVRSATVSRRFFTFERRVKKPFDLLSRYLTSNRNDIGIGPGNIQVGDIIYIPHGSKVPLIIRSSSSLKQQLNEKSTDRQVEPHERRRLIGPTENAISQCSERHELHTLVGDAYVNGYMFAEEPAHETSESVKIFLK